MPTKESVNYDTVIPFYFWSFIFIHTCLSYIDTNHTGLQLDKQSYNTVQT